MKKKKAKKTGKAKAKKVARRTSKKKITKKKLKTKKKLISKKKPSKTASKVVKEKINGQLIGRVTHYFPHVNAAVVVITKGSLKIGDRILIKGHTTQFEEAVNSMQIDHKPISEAKKGDEIGLQVRERTREHDLVYRLN